MAKKPRTLMSFTKEAQRLMRKSPLMRALHPEIFGEAPPADIEETPPQTAPNKVRGNSKYDLEPLRQLVKQHGSNWTYDQYCTGYEKVTGTKVSLGWIHSHVPGLKRECGRP